MIMSIFKAGLVWKHQDIELSRLFREIVFRVDVKGDTGGEG